MTVIHFLFIIDCRCFPFSVTQVLLRFLEIVLWINTLTTTIIPLQLQLMILYSQLNNSYDVLLKAMQPEMMILVLVNTATCQWFSPTANTRIRKPIFLTFRGKLLKYINHRQHFPADKL